LGSGVDLTKDDIAPVKSDPYLTDELREGDSSAVDHILELHLKRRRKADSNDSTVQIIQVVDQLLEVIADNLSDDDAGCNSFRSQLESLQLEILDSGGAVMEGSTALRVIELCRRQFRHAQTRQLERDQNFAEIIAFLRKSLASLTGDSRMFHEDLLGTTDRIRGLVELKDIQELKSKITAEVNELNRAVIEKQKREQIQFAQLSEQIGSLQKKLEEAEAEASLDGLTGIANRRNFDFTIQRWVIAHEKSEEPFTVALLDLDNFKLINDSCGHQTGDHVLVSTALEIGRNIRADDYLARYGGDEFVILASGMKLADSLKRFAVLLRYIENIQFECKNAEKGVLPVSITTSCGLAEYALGENAKDLIRRADDALYEAKRGGKNQVIAKRRPLLGALYEGRKHKSSA
jgi:diguanylate cyclase (GGDEF)-like protein